MSAGVCDEGTIAANVEKYCGVASEETPVTDVTEIQMSVEYRQEEARKVLDMVNDFRQSSTWYWNEDGKTKTYVSNLPKLTYDYKLEQIAMQRAAEIAIHYDHERTNGKPCSDAFQEYGYIGSSGENIAAGTGDTLATAERVFDGWREETKPFEEQGHRRNMLGVGADFTAIGIGYVYYQGNHYWAMELGGVPSGASDTGINGKQTVPVKVKNEYIRQPLSVAMPDKITLGTSVNLPAVYAELHTDETYPQNGLTYMPMGEIKVNWTTADSSIVALENGKLVGKAIGSTEVTATAPVSGRSVSITIKVVDANTSSTGGNENTGSTGGNENTGSTGGSDNTGSTGGNDNSWDGDWNKDPSDEDNNGQTGAVSGVIEGSGITEDLAVYGTRRLAVNPTTFNTMLLSWDAVPGAKSYEIFYSTSPDSGFKKLTNAKKNFYKFSKAKCGVTYYFQMRVCTKGAKSAFGPTSYGKTDLIGASVLQVKKTTYNSVTLKWSKVSGAKKYEILCASSLSGKWESLGVKGGTSFTHKKIPTGATYYYQIRPVRDAFYGSWSNGVSTTTSLADASKLKVKAASADRMKLSWKKVPGAQQYVILRADRIDGTYEIIGHAPKTSYVDTNLQGNTTYFYKVYAVSGPYRSKETDPIGQTTKMPKIK